MILSSELRQHVVNFSSELKAKILDDTCDETTLVYKKSSNVSPSSLVKTRFKHTILSNANLDPSIPTPLCSMSVIIISSYNRKLTPSVVQKH